MIDREKFFSGTIFQRQLDIFNPEDYNIPIHVIGIGATGSFDAMTLAKIGMREVHIWDPDTVETNNTAGQIYGLEDNDTLKVDALEKIIHRLANTKVIKHPCAWEGQRLDGIVIMGADKMKVRKEIFMATRMNPLVRLVCDHRIGAQKAQLFAYDPTDSDALKDFEGTLFSDEEAADLPCTLRSVIDINLFVASMTVRNIRSFLVKGIEAVNYELHYDAEYFKLTKRDLGGTYKNL